MAAGYKTAPQSVSSSDKDTGYDSGSPHHR